MKLVLSSTGESLDSQVDVRFGRCPFFIIAEIENSKIKKTRAIENKAMMQGGGAGITAAQIIANEEIDVVIIINIGPKAVDIFQQLEIEVYQGNQGTVKENIQQFIDGKLTKTDSATGPTFLSGNK
ncbi:NifB/NifX family molybdenum-iron cluster-binding protein [bacterium]|nr:NifB/NifX family molybdenum-iron cluster-binding protein [bacterium]